AGALLVALLRKRRGKPSAVGGSMAAEVIQETVSGNVKLLVTVAWKRPLRVVMMWTSCTKRIES
ncbi:MAG: hypothetical protein LC749_13895, partial [Actinobacteria bacterium]|nr:hypothetical protein [Actinomycetota bacterium]